MAGLRKKREKHPPLYSTEAQRQDVVQQHVEAAQNNHISVDDYLNLKDVTSAPLRAAMKAHATQTWGVHFGSVEDWDNVFENF